MIGASGLTVSLQLFGLAVSLRVAVTVERWRWHTLFFAPLFVPMRALYMYPLHLLLLAFLAPQALGQDATAACDFATAFDHMTAITASCCDGATTGTTCNGGHPGLDNTCSLPCGRLYEPFLDQCGDTLRAAAMDWPGMGDFYINCLEALYPPGACGRHCTTADEFRCRTMEVQQACCPGTTCAAGAAAATGGAVPSSCSLECAVVFSPFMTDCGGAMAANAQPAQMTAYSSFVRKCNKQDPFELVEMADRMIGRGCKVTLPRHGQSSQDGQ